MHFLPHSSEEAVRKISMKILHLKYHETLKGTKNSPKPNIQIKTHRGQTHGKSVFKMTNLKNYLYGMQLNYWDDKRHQQYPCEAILILKYSTTNVVYQEEISK